MEKTRKLVLFGDSAFAEIAREYFDHDSPYEVVAFTVTSEYLRDAGQGRAAGGAVRATSRSCTRRTSTIFTSRWSTTS